MDTSTDPDRLSHSAFRLRWKENNFSTLERLVLRQHIDRHWSRCLTPPEFKIVSHIYDRTIAWGRVIEEISIREFVSGRTNYTSGTGMSESTVHRAIISAEKKGAVGRQVNTGFRSYYGLMFRWIGPQENPFPAITLPSLQWLYGSSETDDEADFPHGEGGQNDTP